MKKILVIDESPLLRNFFKQKFEELGFEVVLAANGLEGSLKLRNSLPDLVIMDYYLSRKSCLELLKEKRDNPNTANVPVIMVSSKIDRERLVDVAKYNIRKFFSKPVKMDSLLKTVSEILQINLNLDNTPCLIEAHFNDDILFIEIAMGLNSEKIELLKYKITELLDLYEVQNPKVLVIMSSLEITANESLKLGSLFSVITEYSHARPRYIKVLTNSEYVHKYIAGRKDFEEIEVTNNLERAMDGLLGRKAGSYMDPNKVTPHEDFLTAAAPKKDRDETIQLRFEGERTAAPDLANMDDKLKLAVVDDDIVIQELIKTAFCDTQFVIETFDNGKLFVDHSGRDSFDLVFLDLMMPVMDGFETLEKLNEGKFDVPIIVLSALSQRETVVKALKSGVKSYLIKPLKPEWIRKKATEILRMNF
jgi:DNA-binding response OmpR family regulator